MIETTTIVIPKLLAKKLNWLKAQLYIQTGKQYTYASAIDHLFYHCPDFDGEE